MEWKNTKKELSGNEKKLYDALFQLIAYEIKEHPFNKDYLVKAEQETPMSCSGSKTKNPFRHTDEPPPKKRRLNPPIEKNRQKTSAYFFHHHESLKDNRLTNHLNLRSRRHPR